MEHEEIIKELESLINGNERLRPECECFSCKHLRESNNVIREAIKIVKEAV